MGITYFSIHCFKEILLTFQLMYSSACQAL